MNAEADPGLGVLMFLVPGMKGSSIAVTGSIQCTCDCNHTTLCVVSVCVHMLVHKHTHLNTGKQRLRKVC